MIYYVYYVCSVFTYVHTCFVVFDPRCCLVCGALLPKEGDSYL